MKKNESTAENLFSSYPSWKIQGLISRRFSPESFHQIVDKIIGTDAGLFAAKEVGSSFEGRSIRLISVGTGRTKVLLWSQMHGDESTATMAIADIFNYFRQHKDDEPTRTILSSLYLLFLPMLNPDGAGRFERRTAQGIDMNRDALALQTPEARILKKLQQDYTPEFGFNLHDQELSTVGTSKELTAVVVLTPSLDEKKSDNEVRTKAKHLAATFVETMKFFIPGKIARYDDSYEPRAFGDNMQRWGTSTVLIESGHALNDPEKQSIRQLNAVGILASLYSIATGAYARSELSLYESLPFNGKKAYDLIIRNIRIRHSNGARTTADLGISYQVDTHTEDTPTLVDLGDLRTFVGFRELDGRETIVPHDALLLGKPFTWEKFFPE